MITEFKQNKLIFDEKLADELKLIINFSMKKNKLFNSDYNKFIFHGSPGTGKTEAAKIIAEELEYKLMYVPVNILYSSKMGETAKNIEKFFKQNAFEKTVILLDEIDSIVSDRKNMSNDIQEMGRITLSIMNVLENLSKQHILIATTNVIEKIDKALLRRFNKQISFDLYDASKLYIIYQNYSRSYSLSEIKGMKTLISEYISTPNQIQILIEEIMIREKLNAQKYSPIFNLIKEKNPIMNDVEILRLLKEFGFTISDMSHMLSKKISRQSLSKKIKE